MVIYEDECVGCPPEIGCIGPICPKRKVPHLICDECNEEETLYLYDGEQLCINCIESRLTKVEEV